MDTKTLIKKYSPIVYLNSNEKFFPCSIDWLLNKSTLIDFNTNTKIKNPSQRDLYNISQKYNFENKIDGDIILSFEKESYNGQTSLSDVPIYALTKFKDNKLYITYIFLYAYNGSYKILELLEIGSHEGDIEIMTVECFLNGNISRVFFGSHGLEDGKWIDASLIEYEDTHIVCYSALHGHGLYYKPGVVLLFPGISDKTNKGIKWSPKVSILYYKEHQNFNIDTMGWSVYNSRIGGRSDFPNTDGIPGIYNKQWYHNGVNPEEKYFKPKNIITNEYTIYFLNILGDFFKILLLYTAIISIKFLIEKYMFHSHTPSKTNYLLQSITISIIILIIYYGIIIHLNSFLLEIYRKRQKYIFPYSQSKYE
jgi:hypothetical protein